MQEKSWRGPTTTEWVERINAGANRVALDAEGRLSGGHWIVPWVQEEADDEADTGATASDERAGDPTE